MSLHANVGGVWQTITGVWVRISGTWQPIASVSTRVAGVWEVVYGSLIAVLDKTYVSGVDTAPGAPVSDAVTCTPSGGTAPYTYSWSRVSGDVVTIDSPSAASTTFSFVNGSGSFVSKTGYYRCTVTDSAAASVNSTDVEVYLESSP